MRPDFRQFGASIYVLIGAIILTGLIFTLLLGGWTAIRVGFWHRTLRRAQRVYHKSRFNADGTRRPPITRGVCQRCGRACAQVYHLPTGERLCPAHYTAHQVTHPSAATKTTSSESA